MENITESKKEEIVSKAKSVAALRQKLGLGSMKGKELKKRLNQYKVFSYNDWEDGAYYKVPVYLFDGDYYCSI